MPLNLADAAAVIDIRSRAVRYVATGPYPYGAAILPGRPDRPRLQRGARHRLGHRPRPATKVKDIQVAANLSHPEGIALDPEALPRVRRDRQRESGRGHRHRRMTLEKVLSVERPQGGGESPVAVAVTPDAKRLFVAEAAADELAVFALPSGR